MSHTVLSQRFSDRYAKTVKSTLGAIGYMEDPSFLLSPEKKIRLEKPSRQVVPPPPPAPKRGRGRPRRNAVENSVEKAYEQLTSTSSVTATRHKNSKTLQLMPTFQDDVIEVASMIADADTSNLRSAVPIDEIRKHVPSDLYGHITGKVPGTRFLIGKDKNFFSGFTEDSDVECLDDDDVVEVEKGEEENPFKYPLPDFTNDSPKYEFKSLWMYRLPELDGPNPAPWETCNVAKPNFVPDVLSIVASMFLGQRLDLGQIAVNSRNIEFNPDRFAPLIMRVRNPKSTSLIFASGKMIVTGTRSETECKLAARKYARVIQKIGYSKIKVLNFEIQNISASTNLKFNVRLRHMAQDSRLKNVISYEPEMFPGLVYPLVYPKVKSIIFCSGAVLMTGARSEEELKTALDIIYPAAKLYGH